MRATAGGEAISCRVRTADLRRLLELGNGAMAVGQQARLAHVFDHYHDRKIYRLGEMLPSKWIPRVHQAPQRSDRYHLHRCLFCRSKFEPIFLSRDETFP